ncbi:MAG: 3-isopropylmalate dehydratase [Chloroflexi bacterium]|nr:3-isopropylmalate dehydratase [Chloroflexota bacterium]
MTITEKILARAAGLKEVTPGQRVKINPDLTMWYNTAATKHFFSLYERIGAKKLAAPEKMIFFIDHHTPVKTPEYANVLKEVKELHQSWGVRIVERLGIGHQVVGEIGAAKPGMMLIHFDAHIATMGAIGVLAIGVGSDLLRYQIEGEGFLTVPDSMKMVLTSKLPRGIQGRDVWLRIMADIGADGGINKVLEFSGPGYEAMSMDDRMGMMNTVRFSGAVTAIANPDQKALDWVRAHTKDPLRPVYGDPDARYAEERRYDLSTLEPYVAVPPNPYDCRPLREVVGVPVQQAYLGSCASGRVEDLRLAAQVFQGRQRHPDVRVNVVATSNEIMQQAAREGIVTTLVEAGVFLSSPSCDYCFGNASPLADGDTCISTGTLNIPGRMGSTKASIYTANAAVVAASAIEGRIADPRRYL